MDTAVFFPLMGVILWAASFLYFRWYLSRRTASEAILREFRDEVDKLVSEIDSATDRDSALVEERIRTLRALLDEADKRIALHSRELDKRKAEEKAYADLGKRKPFTVSAPQAAPVLYTAPAPLSAPASLSVDLNMESPPGYGSAAVQDAEKAPVQQFVRSPEEIVPAPLSFAERVSELYRAGFSADLIAKRLSSTVAEVDLAIALAGRMDARDGDGRRN